MKRLDLSRRLLLKGAAGLTLGLPIFYPKESRAASGLPKRLVLFYVAEGVEQTYWWPTSVRSPTEFSLDNTSLADLAPLKDRLLIVKGIHTESTRVIQKCYHGFSMPHILTGGPASEPQMYVDATTKMTVQVPGGVSVDRVIGKLTQGNAAFSGYELGVRASGEPLKTVLSFDQTAAARYPQNNPYKVFQSFFGGGTATTTPGKDLTAAINETYQRRTSILDLVKSEIATVRCQLGNDGRAKLDAHLTSVRSIEQQLAALYAKQVAGVGNVPQVGPEWTTLSTDMNKIPEIAKVQMDLIKAALASDLTRVAVIQFSNTNSRMRFPFLQSRGVVNSNADHHDVLSHGTDTQDPVKKAQIVEDRKKVYQWFAQQYRYLIETLRDTPEGAGSLLDSSAVVYFSEMSFGNFHSPTNIPILIAGGAQGALKQGQFHDLNPLYRGLYAPRKSDSGRSIGDLWLTLCHAFGLKGLSRLGESAFSAGPIPELLA